MCRRDTGYYYWPNADPDGPIEAYSYPLYQRGYKGSKGYISPRCLACYEKIERRERMGTRKRQHKKDVIEGKEPPFRTGIDKPRIGSPTTEDIDKLIDAMERLERLGRRGF